MLLITGTQRTGSSLLAEFLRQCGYPFDGDNDAVGAHDDQNISLAYRKILEDPTFPWSTYPVTKRMEDVPKLQDLNYEVAKFPFLMMNPLLMEIWIMARGIRDKMLILVREAEKVVQSKKNTEERERIFSTDSKMLQLTPEQLKQNWFDSFLVMMRSGVQFKFLKFPEYVENYDVIFNMLRIWGGLKKVPTKSHLWKDILNRDKITIR